VPRIRSIQDVVDYRLCIGCGACVHVVGSDVGRMVDIPDVGLRPRFSRPLTAQENDAALRVCPGVQVETGRRDEPEEVAFNHHQAGRGLAVWEAHAADPVIRASGSSGGCITALSLYCLEKLGVDFVSHTAMHDSEPWRNRNVISRTRKDLLRGCGSRYGPSSPCLSLDAYEKGDEAGVFIGKPCDAVAVALALKQKPQLAKNVVAVITFFCAGTPSSGASLDLVRRHGLQPGEIGSVRYRGDGWPGRFRATDRSRAERVSLSYEESWAELQSSRGLRCQLCADGMGEAADIACGDAWHRHADDGNPGLSVVIARTRRGLKIVEGAIQAGYLVAEPAGVDSVVASQGSDRGLIRSRSEVWGRLLALWFLRIPRPIYRGASIFSAWLSIPFGRKLRSIGGTAARVFRKKLYGKLPIHLPEGDQ
jgi:coenzyme F420 hydrogenase subunit beta